MAFAMDRLLSKKQVRAVVLYSPSHIARLEAVGQFPKPVSLGVVTCVQTYPFTISPPTTAIGVAIGHKQVRYTEIACQRSKGIGTGQNHVVRRSFCPFTYQSDLLRGSGTTSCDARGIRDKKETNYFQKVSK